jgi:hypothetical protein
MTVQPDTAYRCRECRDTRERSAVIPLANAVLLLNEPCPYCPPLEPPPRQLARDTATDRVGEIMHIARENGAPVEIWLRPVGGGAEWTTKPEHVQRIQPKE